MSKGGKTIMYLKLALSSLIFLATIHNLAIGKLSSFSEIEEYTNHVAYNLDQLAKNIFLLPKTSKFDENVRKVCNQMNEELARSFQTLNEIALSNSYLNTKASEAMEYLNNFMIDILNCPAIYNSMKKYPFNKRTQRSR
jgi:hypothetical protein